MPEDAERADAEFRCDACGRAFSRAAATRRETYGGLDPDTWQKFCCPDCGSAVRTVYVGDE